jgi:hypothetical protein
MPRGRRRTVQKRTRDTSVLGRRNRAHPSTLTAAASTWKSMQAAVSVGPCVSRLPAGAVMSDLSAKCHCHKRESARRSTIAPLAEERSAPARNSVEAITEAVTFADAAKCVHVTRRSAWKNGKHVRQWINTLEDYAFPILGKKPIAAVTTADVLAVLSPIWNAKPETARRVRQRMAVVLEWARAAGHRSGDNPVHRISCALARHKRVHRHLVALPYENVPEFIGHLPSRNGSMACRHPVDACGETKGSWR